MSKGHDHEEDTHGATTIRASKGGGGKLLLGVVAAALLAGGGYFAYKNYASPQDGAQTAYNDTYATDPYDDPVRAGPIQSEEATGDDQLASNASESSAPPPAARRTPARSEPVPEATIGVTPANVTEEELATTQDDGEIVVTAPPRPIWARTPSERRLASYYPTRALERGREGEARLACVVGDAGRLDCDRVSETPGGFGAAAVRVARSFRHATTTADGRNAVGTPVNLRVVFRIEEDRRRG